jgi:hypothetical protein
MTANHILGLLRARHTDDVFVAECKDGPTQSVASHSKLDAWVMPRSWSYPHLTGYEIKVSRADFLGDEKWRNYLPLCNYLYFAAAPGVIRASELPPAIGLMEASATGSRLFIKQKAQYREIHEPSSLYRYVLMCRTTIRGELNSAPSQLAHWQEWLKQCDYEALTGHLVSKEIRQTMDNQIAKVTDENRRLREQNELYAKHREILRSLGLDEHCGVWRFEDRIKNAVAGMNPNDLEAIERAGRAIASVLAVLKRHDAPTNFP